MKNCLQQFLAAKAQGCGSPKLNAVCAGRCIFAGSALGGYAVGSALVCFTVGFALGGCAVGSALGGSSADEHMQDGA